ncbi:MAG: glutamine--fructose-6-phosphate transaminase (isomerizing) [Gammaproteobacteria bacterium]|nr:glutamine--fructose-6-phosphate transaminase (isomerizing) [Gammaproteobacteria bacterium]
MCGIVGAIAERNIVPILVEGLRRLEYRGYDSAGLAIIDGEHLFKRVRTLGKVQELANRLQEHPLSGKIGIAHTRWATHGKPSEANAHPHIVGDIVVVHNGIIENYAELKIALQKKGVTFQSETDTEVIAHLLEQEMKTAKHPLDAINAVVPLLKGAYALVIMHRLHKDRIFAVRKGSPLVIGVGIEENFVGSDSLSLLPVTRRFIYLEEGDTAELSRFEIKIFNHGKAVERPIEELNLNDDAALKGHYKHFMLKEIFEQPRVVANILSQYVEHERVSLESFGERAPHILPKIKHIKIVACGTSYHAGLMAKYWLEDLAGISCDVEIASEYRYRKSVVPTDSLFIAISQSGETADTLAALRLAKEQGYLASLSICNVPTSTMVREADLCFLMCAGLEVGVASTKAFTAEILGLFLLTLALAEIKGQRPVKITELQHLPSIMNQILNLDKEIEKLAEKFKDKEHALFLGRHVYYPLAMEAALKMKEISYIHAEAYAAGELKHGPLALVDDKMPVIVFLPPDALEEKTRSNIEEIATRGGELYVFGQVDQIPEHVHAKWIHIPFNTNPVLYPLIAIIAMQLLAYHVAVLKGTDVDQPRNLAKSVTVE